MARGRRNTPEDRLLAQAARNYWHAPEHRGALVVPCQVSTRSLSFRGVSEQMSDGRDLMVVDVVTVDAEGDARKRCDLVLDRHALAAALTAARSRSFEPNRPERDLP